MLVFQILDETADGAIRLSGVTRIVRDKLEAAKLAQSLGRVLLVDYPYTIIDGSAGPSLKYIPLDELDELNTKGGPGVVFGYEDHGVGVLDPNLYQDVVDAPTLDSWFLEAVGQNRANYESGADGLHPKWLRLYRFTQEVPVDMFTPQLGLDFKRGLTTRLHDVETIVQGELVQIDHYADKELTELVVREQWSYVRDSIGNVVSRQPTRTYYLEDGTAHPTQKVGEPKIYTNNPHKITAEGKKARKNVVNAVQTYISGVLVSLAPVTGDPVTDAAAVQAKLAEGQTFMATHSLDIDMYIGVSSPNIYFAVQSDTTYWLDTDIGGGVLLRDWILAEIDRWGLNS